MRANGLYDTDDYSEAQKLGPDPRLGLPSFPLSLSVLKMSIVSCCCSALEFPTIVFGFSTLPKPIYQSHEIKFPIQNSYSGNSLAVQWLELHTSTAVGTGSIPGQELSKIPHAKLPK